MSKEAREYLYGDDVKPWMDVPEIMQAYADKCVKQERKRVVDGLKKLQGHQMISEEVALGWNNGIEQAIKIVNDLQ